MRTAFQCKTPPPLGYSNCTREPGHPGPCAMGYAPSIFGEAERMYIQTKLSSQQLGQNLNCGILAPDYMILPWRMYWGWVLGRYSTYYPFACRTRVYLNPFCLHPRVHWTVSKEVL